MAYVPFPSIPYPFPFKALQLTPAVIEHLGFWPHLPSRVDKYTLTVGGYMIELYKIPIISVSNAPFCMGYKWSQRHRNGAPRRMCFLHDLIELVDAQWGGGDARLAFAQHCFDKGLREYWDEYHHWRRHYQPGPVPRDYLSYPFPFKECLLMPGVLNLIGYGKFRGPVDSPQVALLRFEGTPWEINIWRKDIDLGSQRITHEYGYMLDGEWKPVYFLHDLIESMDSLFIFKSAFLTTLRDVGLGEYVDSYLDWRQSVSEPVETVLSPEIAAMPSGSPVPLASGNYYFNSELSEDFARLILSERVLLALGAVGNPLETDNARLFVFHFSWQSLHVWMHFVDGANEFYTGEEPISRMRLLDLKDLFSHIGNAASSEFLHQFGARIRACGWWRFIESWQEWQRLEVVKSLDTYERTGHMVHEWHPQPLRLQGMENPAPVSPDAPAPLYCIELKERQRLVIPMNSNSPDLIGEDNYCDRTAARGYLIIAADGKRRWVAEDVFHDAFRFITIHEPKKFD